MCRACYLFHLIISLRSGWPFGSSWTARKTSFFASLLRAVLRGWLLTEVPLSGRSSSPRAKLATNLWKLPIWWQAGSFSVDSEQFKYMLCIYSIYIYLLYIYSLSVYLGFDFIYKKFSISYIYIYERASQPKIWTQVYLPFLLTRVSKTRLRCLTEDCALVWIDHLQRGDILIGTAVLKSHDPVLQNAMVDASNESLLAQSIYANFQFCTHISEFGFFTCTLNIYSGFMWVFSCEYIIYIYIFMIPKSMNPRFSLLDGGWGCTEERVQSGTGATRTTLLHLHLTLAFTNVLREPSKGQFKLYVSTPRRMAGRLGLEQRSYVERSPGLI